MFSDADQQLDLASSPHDLEAIPTAVDEVLKHLHPLLTANIPEIPERELRTKLSLFVNAVHFSHKAFMHAGYVAKCLADLVDSGFLASVLDKPRILKRASESVSLGYENSLDSRNSFQDAKGPLEALVSQLVGGDSNGPDIVIELWNAGQLNITHISRPKFVSHVVHNLDECNRASGTLVSWFEQCRSFLQDETGSLSLPPDRERLMQHVKDTMLSYTDNFKRIFRDYPLLFKPYDQDKFREEVALDKKDRLTRIEVPIPKVPVPPPFKEPPLRQEDVSKIPYEYFTIKPDGKQSYKATLASIDIISPNVSRLTFSFEVIPGSAFITSGFSIGFRFETRDLRHPTSLIQVVATAPNAIHELKDFTTDECNAGIQVTFPEPQMVEWHFGRHLWQVLTGTRFPKTFNLSLSVQHESDITARVAITVFRRPFLVSSNISHKSIHSPTIIEIEGPSNTSPADVDSRAVARLISS
ncbi:hypothetical protein CVT24_012915 [Panaeolus cyanescens]|uniref:Uncharacterized protein n=1 Tax=Panaeolus cyanescens TaxID=181874 RepID=A0A409W2F5_9AGAR|nr:hypothetical protein CVT24_012915 [Panaeolus cyanescens]